VKSKAVLRAVSLLIIFLLVALSPFSANASAYSEGLPDLSAAKTVYLENLETGKVIVRKESGGSIAPASTVKLMTAMLALEHFKGKEETVIEITELMLGGTAGTSMELTAGDRLTALDLIYATLCGGFNDAAYALAFSVGGSINGFVKLMNEKAKALGAVDTVYANPTGYDTAAAATTLRDTVIIAKAASETERLMEISSALSWKISFLNGREPFTVHNRNGLIGPHYFNGYVNYNANGMISGNTDLGGWSVVTKFTTKNASYLCIVMGATEENGVINSYKIANELSDFVRTSLGIVTVMEKGAHVCDVDIKFALSESSSETLTTVSACLGEDATLFIPNGISEGELTRKYYLYAEVLEAPVFEGDRIGGVDFYYNGELLKTVPLVIGEDVKANDILISLNEIRSEILSRTTAISLVLFIILTAVWFVFFDKRKKRRSAKRITYNGVK